MDDQAENTAANSGDVLSNQGKAEIQKDGRRDRVTKPP